MKHYGKTLATKHILHIGPVKDYLLKRLAENEHVLHEVRKLLTDAIKKKYQIAPEGEWLMDIDGLVREQILIQLTDDGVDRYVELRLPGKLNQNQLNNKVPIVMDESGS